MKTNYIKIIALLLILTTFTNCSNDDGNTDINNTTEDITLNLRHYLAPVSGGNSPNPQLVLLGQEGNDSTVRTIPNNIEGFTYELGFNYELLVRKTETQSVPPGVIVVSYELLEIISQTVGSTSETFELGLKFNNSIIGAETFITGDENSGFELLNTIPIECTNICDQLTTEPDEGTSLFGTFTRNSDNVYVLSSTTIL